MSFPVSVVIPNYNGKHLLEEYLPSVFAALKHSGIDSEVIISDDASSDGSLAFIQEKYPAIKTVRSETNRGFSHTANNGIKMAGKKLVLLLNSDVRLQEDYFETQWKYFEDPDTFGVMGSIRSEDGKKLMDAAKYPIWKGGQLRTTVNCRVIPKSDKSCYTLFLSGANALVDREKLLELQGFDTRYSPFYMEDVDLSVRAWRNGWNCFYEKEAVCSHKLSETIATHHKKKKVDLISRRNKFIFHDTHLEGGKRMLWMAENVLNLLFRWISGDMDYYRAYFAYKKTPERKREYKLSLVQVAGKVSKSFEGLEKELF